jgi:hypothetical protein
MIATCGGIIGVPAIFFTFGRPDVTATGEISLSAQREWWVVARDL